MDTDNFMNCEYQVREAQGEPLHDCGKPATHRGVKPPMKFYCADHTAMVSKRGGIATKPLNGTKGEKQ